MHPYLAITLPVLYWVVYPLYLIGYGLILGLLYILQPLATALLFVLQPLFIVGIFISNLLYLPIDIARRFEILYIYLGIGGIIGITAGLVMHLLVTTLVRTLGLKKTPMATGPTAKERREARRRRAEEEASAAPQVLAATINPITTTEKVPDKADSILNAGQTLLSALPRLTIQGPSPEGKRSLLDQTLEEDADSDL